MHGHSYRMRVSVSGTLDEHGMVVDYFDLRRIIDPVIDRIDHAFLCDRSDAPMLAFLQENDLKHVVVSFPSTAENIACWLLEQVVAQLNGYGNITEISVRLHETERTYAEARQRMTPEDERSKPEE